MIDEPLAAGSVVVPARDWKSRLLMGTGGTEPHRTQLGVAALPGGVTLTVVADGRPVLVACEDGEGALAALRGTSDGTGTEGPIPTSQHRDCPLTVAGVQGGLGFVAEGSRLRPTGRRRYLRARAGEQAWTYGMTETMTAPGQHRLGQIFGGDLPTPVQLRRGERPEDGTVVADLVQRLSFDEDDPGRMISTVSWLDGTLRSEVALLLVLWLGTSEPKLQPLWARAVNVTTNNT